MLEDVLRKWGGVDVPPMAVYTDMFSLGQGVLQRNGEESGEFKANPIAYWKNSGKSKGHFRILFDDDFEQTLEELQQADFAILNGITYFGRKNVQEHASKMYAMIIDLDGLDDSKLNNFLHGAFSKDYDIYPLPNYIVLSGHGVHLYYLFEYGIPLFPNIKLQLKALKYALTEKIWNMYTSNEEKKQFQGINQGFRVIGGKTKIDGVCSRAFRMHQHPFNLEQLGKYVPEEFRVDERKLFRETRLTREQAKKKYPEWYEKVVVNGDKTPKLWDISGKVNGDNPHALYDWWKRKIEVGATYHHRYFNIMCLAIYGAKCDKPYEEVEADALEYIPFMNSINQDEPFTEEDVMSALECYDARYATFPIDDIVKISGIEIVKNKRNGRKQAEHLKRARAVQAIDYPAGEWRNQDGRPSAEQIVKEWKEKNPGATKADCIRETGLSKPTVYKWWDNQHTEIKTVSEKMIKEKNDALSDKYFEQIMQQLESMKLSEEQRQRLFEATIESHRSDKMEKKQ